LASGQFIPPISMLKKFIFNLKLTQVRYFLGSKEIEHISFFYYEDGELNIDEKLNLIYLPLNRVIFALLTFEGKMSRLAKSTMNANYYNDILGTSLAEYIMALNPYKFGVFLVYTTNLFFLTKTNTFLHVCSKKQPSLEDCQICTK
jgi:hypothetical protein